MAERLVVATSKTLRVVCTARPGEVTNQQLVDACQGGKFTDVTTELSMHDFIVAQMYTVNATAICK